MTVTCELFPAVPAAWGVPTGVGCARSSPGVGRSNRPIWDGFTPTVFTCGLAVFSRARIPFYRGVPGTDVLRVPFFAPVFNSVVMGSSPTVRIPGMRPHVVRGFFYGGWWQLFIHG